MRWKEEEGPISQETMEGHGGRHGENGGVVEMVLGGAPSVTLTDLQRRFTAQHRWLGWQQGEQRDYPSSAGSTRTFE